MNVQRFGGRFSKIVTQYGNVASLSIHQFIDQTRKVDID